MNKNNYVLVLTIVLVIGAGGYFILMKSADENSEIMEQQTIVDNEREFMMEDELFVLENNVNNESVTDEDISQVKVFEVVGSNFIFSPNEIRVNQGDRVRIGFTSQSGFHDLILDEFDVKTKQMNSGGNEVVEFIADKIGTFEYYCSVGNHRQMGMVGNLIVE